MLMLLAGSLSLVPQLAMQQRVAAPLAARRLAVSPQAALTTDERVVPRDVEKLVFNSCTLTLTLTLSLSLTLTLTLTLTVTLTRCSSATLSMRPRC